MSVTHARPLSARAAPLAAPNCPLCGQTQARILLRTDFNLTGATTADYRVLECAGCRFRFLHPQPTDRELAQFYDRYPAYTLQFSRDSQVSAEQASLNRRLVRIAAHRLRLLRRFRPLPWKGLRVLDIGCGNGAFLLELVRQHDVEAWGMDIAPESLASLEKLEPRLRLVTGDLGTAPLPHGYFDVITLWHVLEHDGDPVRNLRRIAQWLRPGGLLLAEVPNAAGLIARLCGPSWLGWDLPRHLVHFSAATLKRAALQAGWASARVLHDYTLDPICVSPLLASLTIWRRRRQGRKSMKRPVYHRLDGLAGAAIHLLNGVERLLGGNGLVLVARC